jgi:hypothetical protein
MVITMTRASKPVYSGIDAFPYRDSVFPTHIKYRGADRSECEWSVLSKLSIRPAVVDVLRQCDETSRSNPRQNPTFVQQCGRLKND